MYDKSQVMRGTLEGCILKIKCEALRQNNKRKPIHPKIHLMVMKLLQLFWVMDLKI